MFSGWDMRRQFGKWLKTFGGELKEVYVSLFILPHEGLLKTLKKWKPLIGLH